MCKKCDTLLRIEICKEDYGRAVSVTCTECGLTCQVQIIGRENVNELLKELVASSFTTIENNIQILERMRTIVKSGYKVRINICAEIEPIPLEPLPEPNVVDGQIQQGTFTEEDDVFMKEIGSNL